MKKVFNIAILLIFFGNLNAQIKGYTVNGDPVILYNNGSWKYLKIDTVSEMERIAISVADSIVNDIISYSELIGKWKATLLRFTEKEKSKIIQIDLTNPESIKRYTDTIWYDGLYSKLKLDTSLAAKKQILISAAFFEGLQNTFISFNFDSTYQLNNQPILFGIATDSIYKLIYTNKWEYSNKQNILSLKVANDEYRSYLVIKKTENTLIIDEDWRDSNDFPIKEITFIKQ